ncbi:MAG: type II toxin-antitoxin system RelE/ParE family toxin [Scytolyngbya sp. HA4215-MV1]|jgi:toxin ParE1/3/4|nr:type II toxin-antitoxin system RelE/ParE family toxin [Scytolyngbya sp. HA4215-MV1]
MSRYVINILASQDLNDIADYFAENSLEAGDRFFRAFNHKCQLLVAFPNSGKNYATIRPDLRGLSLEGYVICSLHKLCVGKGSPDLFYEKMDFVRPC